MSPASSGTLEVEKYIGACLISSQSRPKTANINSREVFYSHRLPDVYPGSYPDGRFRIQRWAGGMPLISFANNQKRNRDVKGEEQKNPLARLAVHTQGAPLILAKNFQRRNKQKKSFDNSKKSTSVADTVSVTSDESSGSANSDNCLPRIIKPRKRRKKDRKPAILGRNHDGFSTDSASPDIDSIPVSVLQTYTPFIFDPHTYGLVPETLPLVNQQQKHEFNNESETPQLHHSFEDVEESNDVDINGNQTVCQCRYCDPAGQIWDVDRNCYSPFLTAPIRNKSLFNFDNVLPNFSTFEDEDLVNGMSSVSLEEKNDKKVVSGDLEVSTEIVTSLNGHRDIEIKFFSSSSADNVRALTKASDRILSGKQSCENDSSVNKECKFVTDK